MCKKLTALLLTLCLLAALAPAAAAEEPSVVYDASQLSVFQQRTRRQIADRYNEAIAKGGEYDDADSDSWYIRVPSVKAPYDEGLVKQSTLNIMSAMTDFYRWLVGAPPLKQDATGSTELQKGALIRNFDFNHQVSDRYKPADMPQAVWDAGKVEHNILALGYTPQESIVAWCNEGYSLDLGTWNTVGHRVCLLSPSISAYAFGYSGIVAIGRITDDRSNQPQLPFTAFPAPGPAPTELYLATEAAWSVEPDKSRLSVSDPSALRVTVTDGQGSSYVCTQSNGKLLYGTGWMRNDITFVQPDTTQKYYPEGSVFSVVITGMTDVATGRPAELRYQVEFFSMLNDMNTTVASCAPKDFVKLSITDAMNEPATLRMLSALLPDTAVVKTVNGRELELPITGGWTVEPENQCWSATVDSSALPPTVKDPKGLVQKVSVPYEARSYTGMFYCLNDAVPAVGKAGELHLDRYMLGTPGISLYQLRRSADGWSARLRYDQDSPNCAANRESATFSVHSWELTDQGIWVGVYYNTFGSWVAGILEVDLGCKHEHTETLRIEPTCTAQGAVEVCCSACGELISSEPLPALGHAWAEPSYVWAADYQSVTASLVCKNDASHGQSETAQTSCAVTKTPTDREEGEIVYTAEFRGSVFQTQTKKVTVPKLPCDGGIACPGRVFTDMPIKSNWAHDAIDWAIARAITAGTTPTTFTPAGDCTRAQVVTFLWRANGSPAPKTTANPFTDVNPSGFYYNAMLWAVENGITNGLTATTFGPGESCTRAQVVTFLWRTANKPAPRSAACPFTDVKSNGFYYSAMLWAVEQGITNGTSATTFGPDGTCTRAQIVTFLYRGQNLSA